MKARVSKNLSGTLILPSISTKPFVSKQEFEINSDQYWKEDVQNAIRKKFVLITSGEPKPYKTVEIIKTVIGSVALPIVKKVLRDDKPFSIRSELMDTIEFKTLLNNHIIDIVGRKKKKNIDTATESEDVDAVDVVEKKTDAIVWDAVAKADKALEEEEKQQTSPKTVRRVQKKAKKNAKKENINSLIIDTDADDDDVEMKDPSEAFIDDETKAKIANHPILGKKKHAQSTSDEVQWVDVDNVQERIKNHPILGKKKNFDI